MLSSVAFTRLGAWRATALARGQRGFLFAFALFVTCATTPAWSAGSELQSTSRLSFAEVARLTLEQNPQLRAAGYAVDISKAEEKLAAFKPQMQVSSALEYAGGTGNLSGFKSAEYSVSLGSILERGGKRDARVAVASAGTSLAGVDQRIARLDIIAEAGRRFVALAAAESRLRLAERAVEQTGNVQALIEPRVRAARSPRTELLYVQIDVSRAAQSRSAALREVQASRSALSSLWGDPSGNVSVAADLLQLPEVVSAAKLRDRLDTVPDLERFASAERLRDAELRLASSQSVADVTWQIGVRRVQAERDQGLIASVSMPLGARARAEPLLAQARAAKSMVQAESQAARRGLVAQLDLRVADMESARELSDTIESSQIPVANEALELTRRGYEIGRFPYRELAIAQQQILDLERARIEAATLFHQTRIELERLTGGFLDVAE